MHCLEALLSFWRHEYNIENTGVAHSFAAELDDKKRAFLRSNFDIATLVSDVAQLREHRVWNVLSQSPEILPWIDFFGGGFSCKGNSKQNSQRKRNKGCIRSQDRLAPECPRP